jgi:axial budding pattern protein 2
MISIARLLFLVHTLSTFAWGEPTISFPYNAQLPPVARIGNLYSYVFSPHTFRSDLNLTYALGNHPDWLSFEKEERRLFGVPEDAAVPPGQELVGQPFEIVATDDTGSVTMQSTIVVSKDDGPSIKVPISEQIKRFGDYSAPSSIISYPATDFTYSFDAETFKHKPGMINYYASSGDSSPLPAWIRFDADHLTFSGKTPGPEALYQPPQRFDVRLVASDIEGFSSSTIEFSIVVGSHKISTDNPVVELNASRGSSLEFDGLADGIRLDGRPVKPGELNATADSLPSWLSFDPDTWVVKGTPKKDDHSSNFTVKFTDVSSDSLEILAKVNVATGLFETTFHDVEATPGEDFSLDLSQHFRDPDDIEVKIETKPKQGWLSLKGFNIEGKVPKSAKGSAQIFIEATSRSSGARETEALQMIYLAPNGKPTMSSTATASTSQTPRKTNNEKGDNDKDEEDAGGISTGTILLATIMPILAVALLIMLLICCLRRRRNSRSRTEHNKISHPILSSLRVNGSSRGVERLGTSAGPGLHAFRNEKPAPPRAAVLAHSHNSSRSSDTLGSFSSGETMREYMTHDAGPLRRPVTGDADTDAGQSWFTVERTPTAMRSEMSTKSRASDVTVPLSTHQLLVTPPFLSRTGEQTFRGGLELTIPALEEVPSLPLLTDPSREGNDRSTGFYSTITSSSAALPSSRHNSMRTDATAAAAAAAAAATVSATAAAGAAAATKTTKPATPYPQKATSKDASGPEKDWSTLHGSESGEQIPELPLPSSVRLSSGQWAGPRNTDGSWLGNDPHGGLRSLMTETSFSSSENWRVIGQHHKRNEPSLSTAYKALVADNPFVPSSPLTKEVAGPSTKAPETVTEERTGSATSDKPTNWARPKASRSRFSKLNADEKLDGGPSHWRRDDSGKASEGSYMAFL